MNYGYVKNYRYLCSLIKNNTEMIYIWLDESDKHGTYYSNFYGGILVQSQHKEEVLRRMSAIIEELGIKDEIKWQKVNA